KLDNVDGVDGTHGEELNSHPNHPNHESNNSVTLDFKEYMRLRESERRHNDDEDIKRAILEQLPDKITSYICNFDLEEVNLLKEYLLISKSAYNDSMEIDGRLSIEDVEFDLILMLNRVKRKMYEKQETIQELRKYIIKASINVFMNYAHDHLEEEIDFSNINKGKIEKLFQE